MAVLTENEKSGEQIAEWTESFGKKRSYYMRESYRLCANYFIPAPVTEEEMCRGLSTSQKLWGFFS